MDNINFTSFKAFVMAQDESKPINHYSWDTCSIGNHLRHTGADMSSGMEGVYASFALCDDNKKLNDILGNMDIDTMPTYKELQLLLTDYEENTL
tara:strand:+ start:93 stop:374 length:282 start_codon:yes stop_codon:yes gene_type:complete